MSDKPHGDNGWAVSEPEAAATQEGEAAAQDAAELLHPTEVKAAQTGRQKLVKFLKDNVFMIATIGGVIVGFLIGVGVRSAYADREIPAQLLLWLGMPGEIFIRLLKLTILPLIAANIIVVSASLDPKQNGKISLVSFGYIIVANFGSSLIGCVTALIIKPGANIGDLGNSTNLPKKEFAKLTTADVFADLLYNIFPDNVVGVALFKSQTVYDIPLKSQLVNYGAIEAENGTLVLDERKVSNSASVNMIGVIFCAAVFGMAARTLGEQGRPFIAFFQSLAHVVIKVMRWFLWLTPPGVCFMIAVAVANVKDAEATLRKLGLFIVSVTVGLGIHFILLQVVFIAVSRRNPIWFLVKTLRSWAISFATTAPIVAIPEMIECCDLYGISKDISRFVIPFAGAIKGDGSACFVSVAAVFIAQSSGFPISAGTIVIIVLLVSSAMLALPNIPSASLVILVTILTSVGIAETEVALLYSVDWLLDRMRSGSIGLSHCYCAAFTHFVCAGDLKAAAEAEADEAALESGKSGNKEPEDFVANGKELQMMELA